MNLNPDRMISEEQYQHRIIDAATRHGWLVQHTRPAMTSHGWRTPIQGNMGFPDLVLARHGRVLFVEVKSQSGKLSKYQRQWSVMLGDSWRLWRPSDWDEALAELR